MSAEVNESGSEVCPRAARKELDNVIADSRFKATERQRDILKYLGNLRLSGCEHSVKAYSIALDVLGRGSAFDPATDPIVRIEMSRLRSALDAYYEAFGLDHGVTIHIPKGSYLAQFLAGPAPLDEEAWGEDASRTAQVTRRPRLAFREFPQRRSIGAAVAIVTFCAASAWLIHSLVSRPGMTAAPTVYLSMQETKATMKEEAARTRDLLVMSLTRFHAFTVAKSPPSAARLPIPGNAYEIDMKYYGDSDDRTIWWQVSDARTGIVVRSGLDRIDISGRSIAVVEEDLARALGRRFASTQGVVNVVERAAAATGALGNACVLRAEQGLQEGGTNSARSAVECLKHTLAHEPQNTDATALLARALLSANGSEPDAATIETALTLAKQATSNAPNSDRAQTALAEAEFVAGHPDAAIQAGNRALGLNSDNADAGALLSMILYAAGYPEAGVAMAKDVSVQADPPPKSAGFVLALDAYRSGRYSEASLLAEQINCADLGVTILQAASLGHMGAPDASAKLAELRGRAPNFERDFPHELAAARLPAGMLADLQSGLEKAGASFSATAVASASRP